MEILIADMDQTGYDVLPACAVNEMLCNCTDTSQKMSRKVSQHVWF